MKSLKKPLPQLDARPASPVNAVGCSCTQTDVCATCCARLAARDARHDYEMKQLREAMAAHQAKETT